MRIWSPVCTLLAVFSFFKFDLATSSSQHMLCKTVDSIFSNDEAPRSPRLLQGPPGKRGSPGAKGQQGMQGSKGDKGIPGFVNHTAIENSIHEKVNQVTQGFQDAVVNLQTQVDDIKREVRELLCKANKGFSYHSYCYFVVLAEKNTITLDQAKAMCTSSSSRLAYILNGEHQTAVENHVRGNIAGTNAYVWVDLTYSASGRTLTLTNGSGVEFSSYRWFPTFPQGSGTGMGIQADKNVLSDNQGLFNYDPQSKQYGALCVKN